MDLIFFKCISVSNNYYCSRKIALIATLRLRKKSRILVTGTKTFKDYNAFLEYSSIAGIKCTSWNKVRFLEYSVLLENSAVPEL